MEFKYKTHGDTGESNIVFLVSEELNLPQAINDIDKNGLVKNALSADKSFSGKFGQFLRIFISSENKTNMIILAGIGKAEKLTETNLLSLGGKISDLANQLKLENLEIHFDKINNLSLNEAEAVNQLMLGIKLKNYYFNKYYVTKKDDHVQYLKNISISMSQSNEAERLATSFSKIAEGVHLTRDLVSEPPNVIYPASFAKKCEELKTLGVKVTVLDKEAMKKLGMNLLLAVGQGSENDPYTVIMQWNGNPESKDAPLAFIGKGVTFDSGGINIKPSSGIADMKYDMAGAGVVTGLMHTLAARKAKVNVIGAIGLAENMPSGSAQRPSDVVTSMSGQTVEVDNTDAEGRLVLADVLCYVEQKYKPRFMVNLATLTGAIVVALGDGHAGLFSNNDALAEQISKAGKKTGELVWRMPMSEHYDKQINSDIADIKNTGSGSGAGSITAAHFLERFVNKCAWAHLDIAGVTWNKKGTDISPKGATGFGVRLLSQMIADNFE
ncbi:leucyl aminopeptidase [Holosporaceae bacterium 'Namur']|nr:leucyl aminopeptidase [Holosporaceae bacterium 'Namur']